MERTVEGSLEGLFDFGWREVRLIVEEIVSVDGGLAGRVEGDGDREEGGGLFVVVAGIGRLGGGRSLAVSADGEEETKCRGEKKGGGK